MLDPNLWQRVLRRDKSADGSFVYAVRSTDIYCRPSCPSRRPNANQVVIFESGQVAEQAGYRPCRRCYPNQLKRKDRQVDLVERVCTFIQCEDQPPSLEDLAKYFNLSPSHLQRTFKKIVGISPRQYADEIRLKRFKGNLKKGAPITAAIYDAGYASGSSIYENTRKRLGMTPAHYKSGAAKAVITYSTLRCPLGYLLVAKTKKGICALSLGDSPEGLVNWLHKEFPNATLSIDAVDTQAYMASILKYLSGEQPHCDLPLDVQSTAFQRMVWQELQRIPYGAIRSYGEIAEAIGKPSAVRAVARACATNPVSLVVPCHRVLRKTGHLGGYRWGLKRKEALLKLERQKKQEVAKII